MRSVQPIVHVFHVPEFTLVTGTDVKRSDTSIRVLNESIYIWTWQWGANTGKLQQVMLDVLYPGANADGSITFTAINPNEVFNPRQLQSRVFWELATNEPFPGRYPQYGLYKLVS